MTTPDDTMDLRELAAKSGVSVRTIRFYQQQALLDSPGQRGPGARYGLADLNRLLLIRMLQAGHLPLVEIKKCLDAMSDASVAEALSRGQLPIEPGSAADYARMVMALTQVGGGPSKYSKFKGSAKAPESPAAKAARARLAKAKAAKAKAAEKNAQAAPKTQPSAPPLSALDASFSSALREEVPSLSFRVAERAAREGFEIPLTGQSWVRMTLTPNIELHLQHPLSPQEHRLVERMLAATHRDPEMEELP